jgi:hypothetical protein
MVTSLRERLAIRNRNDSSEAARTFGERLLIRRFRVRFPGDPPLPRPPLTRSFALASMILRLLLTRKRRATLTRKHPIVAAGHHPRLSPGFSTKSQSRE